MELIYIVILLGILPLALLLFIQKKIRIDISSFYPMIYFVAISSIYEFLFSIILQINSDYWSRFYILITFIIIELYFYNLLSKKHRTNFIIVSILFISFYCFLFLYWNKINNLQTDSYLSLVQTGFIFIFSILWFIDIFKNLEYDSLLKNPHFYFVSGLILYYSGTVFLFLMSSVIIEKERAYILDYWMLNVFFNFVFRVFLVLGIWKAIRK